MYDGLIKIFNYFATPDKIDSQDILSYFDQSKYFYQCLIID